MGENEDEKNKPTGLSGLENEWNLVYLIAFIIGLLWIVAGLSSGALPNIMAVSKVSVVFSASMFPVYIAIAAILLPLAFRSMMGVLFYFSRLREGEKTLGYCIQLLRLSVIAVGIGLFAWGLYGLISLANGTSVSMGSLFGHIAAVSFVLSFVCQLVFLNLKNQGFFGGLKRSDGTKTPEEKSLSKDMFIYGMVFTFLGALTCSAAREPLTF